MNNKRRFIKILFVFIICICINKNTYANDEEILKSQIEALGIHDFINESNQYTSEIFEDIKISDVMTNAVQGKVDNSTLFKRILNIFAKEIRTLIADFGGIIAIILIHSILKSITDGLENKNISEIVYYVQYILIITIIMSNFSEIITLMKESITKLVDFSYMLLPILIALMSVTGSAISATMVQPILLLMIVFIGNIITNLIIPIVLISISIGIISNISNKVKIDKISKFLKSSVVWGLGVVLTLFVSVLSLEGTLTSNVDGITAKTAKSAVSTVVPVVGKILGDATDVVLGCGSILKNSTGIVGIIVVIAICIVPLVKLIVLTITYNLVAAICQPIADEKILNVLGQIGDAFKILLAVMFAVVTMYIIGVTLVIKISNTGLMYR